MLRLEFIIKFMLEKHEPAISPLSKQGFHAAITTQISTFMGTSLLWSPDVISHWLKLCVQHWSCSQYKQHNPNLQNLTMAKIPKTEEENFRTLQNL